jgi:cytochrome c-type biogenesis protein CcmH
MRRKLILLFGLMLMIGLLISGVALAQDGTPPPPTARPVTSDDVNRIARQMYCPICENEPLDACRTAACAQWRAQIGQLLSEGQTESQIKQYFVERYGLRVLAEPPASGVTLWLWVLPVIGLVIGGAYVVILMRRMRARNTASVKAAASAPKPSDAGDYAQRVEHDLKNF